MHPITIKTRLQQLLDSYDKLRQAPTQTALRRHRRDLDALISSIPDQDELLKMRNALARLIMDFEEIEKFRNNLGPALLSQFRREMQSVYNSLPIALPPDLKPSPDPKPVKPSSDQADPVGHAWIPAEIVVCLQCQSEIRGDQLLYRYPPSSTDPTAWPQRTVTSVCPVCDSIYRAQQFSKDGRWVLFGSPERLTDQQEISAAREAIDKRHGIVRV